MVKDEVIFVRVPKELKVDFEGKCEAVRRSSSDVLREIVKNWTYDTTTPSYAEIVSTFPKILDKLEKIEEIERLLKKIEVWRPIDRQSSVKRPLLE